MSENFDLFGDPVPTGGGRRGRPEHIPTEENRNKIRMLLALGWNNERIAKALAITPPTLRKNYFRVLKYRDEMRDRLDAAVAMKLWAGVEDGNVGAIREFRRMLERNDTMLPGRPAPVQAERPKKQAKLGKKESADLEAQTAHEDSEWSSLLTH